MMIRVLCLLVTVSAFVQAGPPNELRKKPCIYLVLGSTRQGRTSSKIAAELRRMLQYRSDVIAEIVDLRDYDLPFLAEEVAPVSRDRITDAAVQAWSDKITAAHGFIIIVPEYNGGYPGVLKNALDSLYKEWNNKPVALVGYSGGSSGASCAMAQLHDVVKALKMVPIEQEISIPSVWKAFDNKGSFVDKDIESQLNRMIDQLVVKINCN
jgi:NAD(P)H-dependent FMN reductase